MRHGCGRLLWEARENTAGPRELRPPTPMLTPGPCPQASADPGLPPPLSSGARPTLRPKTCTDCKGPLDGMAANVDESSSPRGAATGKGKCGATPAAFQGLRRRLRCCVATGVSFTAHSFTAGLRVSGGKVGPLSGGGGTCEWKGRGMKCAGCSCGRRAGTVCLHILGLHWSPPVYLHFGSLIISLNVLHPKFSPSSEHACS